MSDDDRARFVAHGGMVAEWEEAVRLSGHDPGPDVCAALVITSDDVPLLMPNPDAEGCLDPEHIYIEANELVEAFRAHGPRPPWSRLPDGTYISALLNPWRAR